MLVAAVFLVAIIYLLPSFVPGMWPHKKINLGLDLQGGMHLVLEVQVDKAVESTLERISQDLKSTMRKEKVKFVRIDHTEKSGITVQIEGAEQIEKFNQLLDREFADLRLAKDTTDASLRTVVLDLPDKEAENIRRMAVDQALETIRNRIDQFGVSEPDIRRQGAKRILIQLPGVKDTQRAKKLIGKTALLEFKLVDEVHDVDEAVKGKIPPGSQLLYETSRDNATARVRKIPMLVYKRTLLTGAYLTDAKVQIDSSYGQPYVAIDFDKKGGRIFARVTEENVKKRLAIVLDDAIYSAPSISEPITGGKARITGGFTMEEASDLAIVLRAGSLPAPVSILEERTVGPSLGQDSINKGVMSMLIGGLLVVVFMVIYYKMAGLIADLALALNIVLISASLAGFQATLTLPGIAGIILTIGMAVDANVLIFERIREELRRGKTPAAAVDAGYDRATLTILDANVTTLIAALVLFQFGTGPVKGFAVTLSLGVLASVFTALVVSRMIFEKLLLTRKVRQLSI